MNNLLTTLSFSIYFNKGVYALLLGSGISRSAGIPTGWNIVTDLIHKLAVQYGTSNIDNPEKWFEEQYGESPNYSTILSKLVHTQTERVNLLKPYFEPNEEEIENHLKEPTKAHRAIAQLAKDGYIKLVLTTNFDRLLEKALEDVGIIPQVICHSDDIDGAIPLVHAGFTIVKINGDYIDCRFLNTEDELADYPDKLKDYVLRIVNEFGVITCGWSGELDKGLVNIIRSSENRRYESYFTYCNKCENTLKELATFRCGNVLAIENADSFFTELAERVMALSSLEGNHPLSKDIAVERLKRYIVKSEKIILYNDLFENEAERACNKIIQYYNFPLNSQTFNECLKRHLNAIDTLLPMCITAVRWSKPVHEQAIFDMLTRFVEFPIKCGGSYQSETVKLHYLSGLLLMYVVGISCIKYDKYSFLNKILHISARNSIHDDKVNITGIIHPCIFDRDIANNFIGHGNKYTPISTLIHNKIRSLFNSILREDLDFDITFDIFEYLYSLNYLYLNGEEFGRVWVPWGEYKWRAINYTRMTNDPFNSFFAEADKLRDNWLPLKGNMFDGKYSTYTETKQKVDEFLKKIYLH